MGSTALHIAAMAGQLPIVKTLVGRGADVNILNDFGYDALKLAAQSGFSDIVEFLINCGAGVNTSIPCGDTALHLATEFGHLETSQTLLKCHANFNCANELGLTHLHLAAREGDLVILQLLLQAGMTANLDNANSIEVNGDSSIRAEFTVEDDKILSSLQLAAQGGHIEVVQELFEDKGHYKPRESSAALYYAAARGHRHTVELLLDHGIKQVTKNLGGNTAIHVVTMNGNPQFLARLLKAPQFNVNPRNNMNWTPLHIASQLGNVEIVRKLVASGAEVRSVINNQITSLHIAAEAGHVRIVQKLQRAVDTSQACNSEGHTAFCLAIEKGNVAVAEELLQAYQKKKSHIDQTLPFHSAGLPE